MRMEFEVTSRPEFFDLVDATGRIGSLYYARADERGPG